ncbi:MAG: Sua5 family C-terminal domain-containing protein, partial [Gammaproteobacteria bacterium]
PRILRPGMIDTATIARIAGAPLATDPAPAPRVSGSLAQHYAPSTPLELLDGALLVTRAAALAAQGRRVAVMASAAVCARLGAVAVAHATPAQPAAYAQALYATLHALDAADAAHILVEQPPPGADWDAIRDRLGRAAAGAGRGD